MNKLLIHQDKIGKNMETIYGKKMGAKEARRERRK